MSEVRYSFEWIARAIESCTNQFHFEGIDALIELFRAKYDDQELVVGLMDMRARKYNSVHNILS